MAAAGLSPSGAWTGVARQRSSSSAPVQEAGDEGVAELGDLISADARTLRLKRVRIEVVHRLVVLPLRILVPPLGGHRVMSAALRIVGASFPPHN